MSNMGYLVRWSSREFLQQKLASREKSLDANHVNKIRTQWKNSAYSCIFIQHSAYSKVARAPWGINDQSAVTLSRCQPVRPLTVFTHPWFCDKFIILCCLLVCLLFHLWILFGTFPLDLCTGSMEHVCLCILLTCNYDTWTSLRSNYVNCYLTFHL